jgi:hypothetical protein
MRKNLIGAVVVALLIGLTAHLGAIYAASETITVAATAIGFTSATIRQGNGHGQANHALCVVSTAAINVDWSGGTAPTSSTGVPVQVGSTILLDRPEFLASFLAIRSTSVSGSLSCVYWE